MAAIAEAGKEATVPCITAYDAGRCFKVCRVGDGVAFVIYEGQALGIQQKARHSSYVTHVVYLAAGVRVEQLEVGSHLRILPWLARQVELDRTCQAGVGNVIHRIPARVAGDTAEGQGITVIVSNAGDDPLSFPQVLDVIFI